MTFRRLRNLVQRIRYGTKLQSQPQKPTQPQPQHTLMPLGSHGPEGSLHPSPPSTHPSHLSALPPPNPPKPLTRKTRFPPHPHPLPIYEIPSFQFPSTPLVVSDYPPLPSQMVAVREAGVHYPAIMLNYELASRMQNSLKLGREYERLVEENGFRKRRVVFVEQALLGELEIKDREWEGMVGKYGKRGEPGSGLVVGERGFTVEVRDVLHKNFNARCVLEGKLMRLKSIVEKMDEQERELREQVAPSWEAWQVLLEGVFEGCGLLERREKSKEGYNPAEEKGLAEEGKYPSRVFGDRGERDRSDVERMITELVS